MEEGRTHARRLGGTRLLDGLWKRPGIDRVLRRLLAGRGHTTPVERLVFAMPANRALEPSSKLAMEHWVSSEVLIDGLPEVEVHQLYRAMDFLLEAEEEIQRTRPHRAPGVGPGVGRGAGPLPTCAR